MTGSVPPPEPQRNSPLRTLRIHARQAVDWIGSNVPPGFRLVLGLMLVAGGILGFLPVLGFWMIPLGLAVAAMDVRGLWHLLQAVRSRRR